MNGSKIAPRRFLILEGVYSKTGQMCNIPKMMKLKHKYKLRLLIDESVSFGSLGDTGRGVTEHFKVAVRILLIGNGRVNIKYCEGESRFFLKKGSISCLGS